jgi:hypothetical protein
MDAEMKMTLEAETTLGDIAEGGNVVPDPIPVLVGYQFGQKTLNATLPFLKFYENSEVANEHRVAERGEDAESVSNRRLDKEHAIRIAKYMLKGLVMAVQRKLKAASDTSLDDVIAAVLRELGEQPYLALQAMTVNIRECAPGGTDLRAKQLENGATILYLGSGQIFWVVDGQHRREAMNMVINGFLRPVTSTKRYPKKGLYVPTNGELVLSAGERRLWNLALEAARSNCTVDVTIHLGLDPVQERQLFHDLNNLAKTVEKSIANSFDTGNPVNLFIRKVLEEEKILKAPLVEQDANHIWNLNNGSVSRKDIVLACSLLFAGQTDPKKVKPAAVNTCYDLGRRFWRALSSVPHFGELSSNDKTVLAQPVVLKALAQLVYTFKASREENSMHLETFLSALEKHQIDFAHTNPMWRIFEEPTSKREELCPGISDAITPETAGFNLTIGSWDSVNQVMRFSTNSRDVQRHLGDIIRWKLGLPKRPALVKVQQEAMKKVSTAA